VSFEEGDRERGSILQGLDSSDDELRRLSVERLLALPSAEAIPRLIDCLGDSSWRVRKAAIERIVACPEVDRAAEALVSALADGENPGRRNAAVEALVSCGEPVVSRLISALGSDDVDVRKLVVDAIAGIGSPSGCEAMVSTLDDPDPNVRAAAVDALGVIGSERAGAALRRVLVRRGEEQLVCFSALKALARLEERVEPSELAAALEDPILRPAALALLGHCDGGDAVECLLKGVQSAARASREAAMQALLLILSRSDLERASGLVEGIRETVRANPGVMASSIERLGEADLATRLVLIQFLGLVGAAESVVPILVAGRDEALAEVAHATLEAMGAVAEQALDRSWESLETELRRDACELLGCTEGRYGTARLESALDEGDVELRSAAARALGQRRCATALPALVRRLERVAGSDDIDADEEQAALLEALVSLADPRDGADSSLADDTVELLASLVEDAAEGLRLCVAMVLGRIGCARDAELVTSLMRDPSAPVRRAAVEALSHIDSQPDSQPDSQLASGAASEPLRLALADESPLVRIAAATALGSSRSEGVVDDLESLVHDADWRVRAATVRAIGTHFAVADADPRRDEAVALVRHALGDEGLVAVAAVEALGQIGGEGAARVACELLHHGEADLVRAAVGCVGAHGDAAALGELLHLIPHPSWSVRAEVIQTLADRHQQHAVPHILRRLETEQDSFVRDTILRALKRLEG